MTLTPTDFIPKKWWLNPEIFDGKSKMIEVKPDDELSWATITGFSDKVPGKVGWLGLHWIYELYDKRTDTKVIEYIADDKWFANLEDRSNDNQVLDKMILESYVRFTEHFDTEKTKHGIVRGMPNIQPAELSQVRADILKNLKMKGF